MEKPVLNIEALKERQKVSHIVLIGMFLALIAWVIITMAQGVIYCGSLLMFKKL